MRRLINTYPKHDKVDKVLQHLGEDFAHDAIHDLSGAEEDDGDNSEAAASDGEGETAVAADCEDESAAGSDGDDETAVAAICDDPLTTDAADDDVDKDIVPLSEKDAEVVNQSQLQVAALQTSIEAIRQTGQLRVVQVMQQEISKIKRRERKLSLESPVVAEAFKRQRLVEEHEFRERLLRVRQEKARRKDAQMAVAAKEAALAQLRKTKRSIQDLESKAACNAAMKTFPIDLLGAGDCKAGGAKARKCRFDVLDRLAQNGAKLSSSQKNDFDWWKHAWDEWGCLEYKSMWGETFASWMQQILTSHVINAFSTFMHCETNRVLRDKKALVVPGS